MAVAVDVRERTWAFQSPDLRALALPLLAELLLGYRLPDAHETAARLADELACDLAGEIRIDIPDMRWAGGMSTRQMFGLAGWGRLIARRAWDELLKHAVASYARAELRRRGLIEPGR